MKVLINKKTMPLAKGKKNMGKNIKMEMSHGKPYKQAVAIALSTAKVPVKKTKKVTVFSSQNKSKKK